MAVVCEVKDYGPVAQDYGGLVVMGVRSGISLDVAVHNDGKRPLRVARVGVVGERGALLALGGEEPLPKIIQPAEISWNVTKTSKR